MTQEEYYKAPSQQVFDEIKAGAIKIWNTYDNEYGYATDKINRIKDIQNFKDNAWFIVAMFDYQNQRKLMLEVSPDTAAIIEDVIKGV